MTTWPEPGFFPMNYPDAATGATVLSMVKGHFGDMPSYLDLLLGRLGGSLGEVSAIALLLGFIWLLWKKIITWHIPVSFIGTIIIVAYLYYYFLGFTHPGFISLLHIFSGGIFLGAFFMATDLVTSPVSGIGMIIFGIGCGLLTFTIRVLGGYPEGVSYSILIMNATVPLIDRFTKPTVFGVSKERL
jgi:electron transport complex protein RnfD